MPDPVNAVDPSIGCESACTCSCAAKRIAELEAAVLAAKVLLEPTNEATEAAWQVLNDAYHRAR